MNSTEIDPKAVDLMNLMPDYRCHRLLSSPELQSLMRVLQGMEGDLWRWEEKEQPRRSRAAGKVASKLESPSVRWSL